MFRKADSSFSLSSDTSEKLHKSSSGLPNAYSTHSIAESEEGNGTEDGVIKINSTGKRLLKCAKEYRAQTTWEGFAPGPPQLATKHMYDVGEGSWVQEEVLIEIDQEPFGRGALRECFRMREVPMEHHEHAADAEGTNHSEVNHVGSFSDIVSAVVKINDSKHRRCWVAKRSMTETDAAKHRNDCLADAALQQVAKHYAELFNAASRPIKGEASKVYGFHEVDFLMAHVIELADGSTFGVETYVFGSYEKYNNNSGQVTRPLEYVTPQTFSYFTFVQSGHRLMIVDIQGVETLFTDPVIHFLPAHNPSLAALGDQSVNLGVRGMALFLWSHRNSPLDHLFDLPVFQHAASEKGQHGGIAGLTVAQLATQAFKEKGGRASQAQGSPKGGAARAVPLASIPGVDLSVEAWADMQVIVTDEALPLSMVPAACHMEIADMYDQGRIGASGTEHKAEAEAAIFHLALAAKQGLPEAALAFARICSGMPHEDFLSGVECGPEHNMLCLLLLDRLVSAAGSRANLPWAQAARGALAGLLDSGSMGTRDPVAAARHYEAFAEAEMAAEEPAPRPERGLEVSSMHGETFGWENHGLEAHAALARAAELYKGQPGADAKAHARRLWEAASECALEDPRLAKRAMQYMALAEAVDEAEEPEEPEEAQEAPSAAATAPTPAPAPAAASSAAARPPRPLRVEVASASGKPVEGAEVALWDLQTKAKVSEVALTDSHGVAKLLAPAAAQGKLVLRVSKAGLRLQEVAVRSPA